jgi:response regulator NasT
MRQDLAGTHPGADDYHALTERVAAVRAALAENSERLAAAAERLKVTQYSLANGRSQREQLHESAYARLVAKLETMPVIEQAKGILIAQTGCTPEEAFDMLRRASQRSNVRVSELAAGIVDRAVTRGRPDRQQEPGPPGPVRGVRLPD